MKKKIRILRHWGLALSVCLAGQPSFSQQIAALHSAKGGNTQGSNQAVSKTLKQALSELETKYHVFFIYESQVVDEKTITEHDTGDNLETSLRRLLKPLNLKYEKVKDNVYVIILPESDKRSLKEIRKRVNTAKESGSADMDGIFNGEVLAKLDYVYSYLEKVADLTVAGTVTSESGEPMPGVSVVVKGTANGTTTDAAGKYRISAPEGATLVFSFVGYTPEEVAVGSRTTINVALVPDIKALSEVVVVAYGTQKRSSVTGAISSVSSKDITALPVPSVEQAIQGRVAGVLVVNNGQPGDAPLVRLRGVNSINYASGPLYVVDGIPSVGDFNNFDSRDIESVEVLKDANSAALYGSRAAAGVILVTTRKGKRDGKLHVSLDSYYGLQTAWRQLDLLNRDEYIQYGTALRTNAGQPVPTRFNNLNTPIYPGATQTYAQTDTDWQKEMFRTAPITHNTISLSGGNDVSRVYASAGYFKQEGIMLGTGYERANFRINSDHNLGRKFNFGQTLLISYGRQQQEPNLGGRTQLKNIIHMTPYIPVQDPTLVGGYRGPDGADGSDPQNPVRGALQDLSIAENVRILGSVFGEATLMPWLKYRLNVGLAFNSFRQYQYGPIYNESFNARALASLTDNRSTFVSPVVTNQLTFDKTFGRHNVNLIGAIEYQTFKTLGLSGSGNASSNEVKELSGLSNQSINGFRDESVIYSYISRLNYEFGGKYLLSASIRYDGSSSFAPGKKFGTFPSIGLGWRISEEPFMKNIPTISELKIRGSYGLLGNIPGNYLWQSTISTNTNAIFGGVRTQGAFFNRLGNRDLEWEITKMTNIGLDLGLWSNKVTFTAEYYSRRSDNLILDVPLVPSQGFSQSTIANIGDMTNSGFEFQVGYNKTSGNFKWNVSVNASTVYNKVNKLSTSNAFIDRGNSADYGGFDITRTQAGHPVQSFYGWVTDGLFQSDAEVRGQANAKAGDIRFRDLNGDGVINADDRTFLGSFLPDLIYGLNFSGSYKNFDLTVFLQGSQGNDVYNGVKVISQGMLRLFNASTDVLRAWTPNNTNTNVPRAVDGDPNNNTRTSDRFLEDGSYLRLKNISLGYTIPAPVLKSFTRGTLTNARVYLSAQNLLTFTNYTGYDPEIGSRFGAQLTSGIDYGQFPAARTVMLGLQIGF